MLVGSLKCDILVQSLPRFERRIFPGEELHKKRQLLTFGYDRDQESLYHGALDTLQVDLLNPTSGCEKYPSLEMVETCKKGKILIQTFKCIAALLCEL